jgi:3-hydroxyisobutyrate dehydrogenase-like beta-hydroxyacid dehydrogenase
MKLATNAMLHAVNHAFAEAMVLAEAAGIPPEAAHDALSDGAAGAPLLHYRRDLYLGRDDAVQFALSLALKDMRLAVDLAEASGVPHRLAALVRDRLAEADAAAAGERDMAALLELTRKETP